MIKRIAYYALAGLVAFAIGASYISATTQPAPMANATRPARA